jgi:hypothetical protein
MRAPARFLITLALGLLLGLGGAGAALAQLPDSIHLRIEPPAPTYPANASVRYEIEMATAGQPANVGFDWFGPSWPGGREFEGAPLEFEDPVLEGPGTIRRSEGVAIGYPLYGIPAACLRGRARGRTADGDAWDVHLPPGVTSTLSVPATLVSAPWPTIDYTPQFDAFQITSDGELVGEPARMAVPRLGFSGLSGVQIRIRANLKRGGSYFKPSRRTPPLAGATFPALIHQPIELRAVGVSSHLRRQILTNVTLANWQAKKTRRLGRVRTDGAGRFRLKPHRLRRGLYRVLARYRGGQPGVTEDWNCGPLINVGPPARGE